jgi:hypothetical protein
LCGRPPAASTTRALRIVGPRSSFAPGWQTNVPECQIKSEFADVYIAESTRKQAKRLPTADRKNSMKIRRIPKTETLGYCHGCHNRAALEVTVSSLRPPLRLCERDARHLIKQLAVRLEDQLQG